ncbi:MAG: fumarate hydratase C-terminal domain-containing protein [Candidatus Izemoplasmatales bacterium]|nr:fumarate hydratase C-terminal domain-containing protein [Candidatus Izemoplasmatales bacterium]MDD4595375.1 fumarate hydratase C-terminal domain-containing protein [Candidatus Izemoplasmatales bacterium]
MSQDIIKLTTPISDEARLKLRVGDLVHISGVIYTGRDAAHKLMVQAITSGETLPFELNHQAIYYVGPTPAKPGQVIGSCGPTSSYRMDPYSPVLMENGLKVMIGKGPRSKVFQAELVKNQAVYLDVTGGIGALLSKRVLKMEVIAYPWLESEAVHKLLVVDFPAIVAYDTFGNDIFE